MIMNNDTPADAITVTQADKDLLEALQAVSTNGYVGGYIMEVEGLEIIARHRTTSLAAQDGLDWKEAHENLLAVRQQDIAALQSKIESLEAQLKFKNEAINLTKGCPGKVVVRNGFYVVDCYKKKALNALSAIKGDKS